MNEQSKSFIKSLIDEINGIDKEIKTLKLRVKGLNSRRKTVEKQILEFLEQNEQPGVKYKNLAFYQETKARRKIKKKADKRNDCMNVLNSLGIQNSESAYRAIENAMRGNVREENALTIKKIRR
tara:strand:- start:100 stop:471 length:372 start_codon:yes stop_codon:yes gene_type:complete